VAAIVSNDPANARVAIREVFSSPENASRISFPGHHRSAETKERAYVRGTFFRDGGDELEEEAEVEEETPAAEEVLEGAEVTEEPLAVDTEDDDDSEDEAEE